MRSSFFEFNVAISGLFTARANLEVTSHNIANAAIKGFSRQYVEQRAYYPLATFNGKGMVGTGSEVYGVGQIRDFYLDRKYWAERGVLGEYGAKSGQLAITESIFNELADASLTNIFNDFFDKLQSLNENAGDFTYRTNVIQSADTIVSMVKYQANCLYKQQSDINEEIKAIVQIINSLGQQITSLNKQIVVYELDGSRANDLRDQRARLVDELSLYVNVDVKETEANKDYAAGLYPEPEDRGRSDKRFSVLINGYEFINHYDVFPLDVRQRADTEQRNPFDVPGLYDIYFANGNRFNIYHPNLKGELKGLIDMRDGNNGTTTINGINYNTNSKGIPHYIEKLNYMLRTFARAFNEGLDKDGLPMHGIAGHINGYDLNGARGDFFFTFTDSRGNAVSYYDENGGPVSYFYTNAYGEILKYTAYDENGAVIPYYEIAGLNSDGTLRLRDGTNAGIFDANGLPVTAPQPMIDFYESMNVFNFAVDPKLFKDPSLFAAADDDLMDQSNNEIIKGLLKIKNYTHLFKEGQLSDYISGMITELGIDRKQADKFTKNYTDVTTMINNQRIQVSGVDINEEMVEMIRAQHLYQAAARLVSIIDSIYDTTVNRLGYW